MKAWRQRSSSSGSNAQAAAVIPVTIVSVVIDGDDDTRIIWTFSASIIVLSDGTGMQVGGQIAVSDDGPAGNSITLVYGESFSSGLPWVFDAPTTSISFVGGGSVASTSGTLP